MASIHELGINRLGFAFYIAAASCIFCGVGCEKPGRNITESGLGEYCMARAVCLYGVYFFG